jgi:hypothetical protein
MEDESIQPIYPGLEHQKDDGQKESNKFHYPKLTKGKPIDHSPVVIEETLEERNVNNDRTQGVASTKGRRKSKEHLPKQVKKLPNYKALKRRQGKSSSEES